MRIRTLPATLATVAIVALFNACSNEDYPNDEHGRTGNLITIIASQGTGNNKAETRLTHSDDTPLATGGEMTITWAAPTHTGTNDAFMLYDSKGGIPFTIKSITNDGTTATFEGIKPEDGDTYKAFYPAGKAKDIEGNPLAWNDCEFDMTGQIQTGDGDTQHLSDYHYMTASGSDYNSLSFTAQIAILKFVVTLPTDETPSMLTLEANGIVVSKKVTDTDNTGATLDNQLSLELSGITTNTFTAYMAILPFSVEAGAGYAVTITTKSGKVYEYIADNTTDKLFVAENVYNIALTTDTPTGNYKELTEVSYTWYDTTEISNRLLGLGTLASPYLIRHAGNLKCFFEKIDGDSNPVYSANVGGKDIHYQLTNNLQIDISSWSGYNFYGQLNGADKAIRFLSTIPTQGLFSKVNTGSAISDLTVEADEGIHYTFSSPVPGMQVGGVCGSSTGATLTNCKYIGDITIENINAVNNYLAEFSFGGVCGSNKNGTLNECLFEGSIAVESTNSRSEFPDFVYIGGMCGYNANGVLKQCTVTGNVTGTNVAYRFVYVGGICGKQESAASIQSCNYTGDISVTDEVAYVGGICGESGENTCSITNCITVSGSNLTIEEYRSVDAQAFLGGICGCNYAYIGGGCVNNATITNKGNGTNSQYKDPTGGICGYNYGEIHQSTNNYYTITVTRGDASKGILVGINDSSGSIYDCCSPTAGTEDINLIGDGSSLKTCTIH